MNALATAAPAKINLILRILERRADGFHEIDTVFQAIELADRVEVEIAPAGAGGPIELEVDGPDLCPPEENLAWRAAEAFLAASDSSQGVRIRLTKKIPAGGGLGGGSSDAGAVLRLLDALIGGLTPGVLLQLAADLGSDVPFFLGDGTMAHGTGRGEVLEALSPLPVRDVLVGLPPVHIATGPAYAAVATARASGAPISRPLHKSDRPVSWAEVAAMAENDFEAFAVAEHPKVARTLEALGDCDPEVVMLSGSGAACFAVLRENADAEPMARALSDRLGWPVVASRTLNQWPEPGTRGTGGSSRG